ncbi:hypothetical protein Ddye_031363 [Dipteronia dyeriana]|uniref:Uncharacterized protein n=1 Tax=Dipteronia dyeriana TaxID=168575 RepID=A0AAD9WMI6_9ROSI|nr:hypothetical protein Ddye_031363 [Dipteronia dyeriana]
MDKSIFMRAKKVRNGSALDGVLDNYFHLDRCLRNALLLDFIMEIKGVIELNVYLNWRVQYVDNSFFAAFVLSLIAINAVATPLIQIFYKRETNLDACSIVESHLRTVQSARPNGEFRVLRCIHVEDNVNGLFTLLKALNPSEINLICAYTLHLMQLIGLSAPPLAPYESHRKIIQPNSTDRIMQALLNFSKTSSVPITIQPLRVIAPYKTMHETISKLARDEVIPLIIVPFLESLEFHRKKNILRNTEEDNENERHQDEALIEEFMNSNIGNARVVCHEVVVAEETMQVMNAIHSVENSYDLVIVGKRQGHNSLLVKEMSPWVVYMELGVIGDMVASSDFCGGTMSVLVMHCVGVLGDYDNGTSKPGTEFSLSNSYERSNYSFSSSICDVDNDKNH